MEAVDLRGPCRVCMIDTEISNTFLESSDIVLSLVPDQNWYLKVDQISPTLFPILMGSKMPYSKKGFASGKVSNGTPCKKMHFVSFSDQCKQITAVCMLNKNITLIV